MHKLIKIKAAQVEHIKGLITFSEFMQIVADVNKGAY